jgi:protoheme IX farnesyltransferase
MILTLALKNKIRLSKFIGRMGLDKNSLNYSIKNFCKLSPVEVNIPKINSQHNQKKTEDIVKEIYEAKIIPDQTNITENPTAELPKSKYSRILKDLMQLTKFKLCILNSVVAISTYGLNSTDLHQLTDFFLFFNGTMCIAMASQVLNQITEKHEDSQMKRTCGRPLPKQRISDKTAFKIFGSLWLMSTAMYSLTCPHAILFANLILVLYNMAYTPQKKYSNLSMHLGAVVGALPALLGNFAATGVLFEENGVLLSLYVFAWQYVHFYGILYNNKEDYKKAGFKFISNDDSKIIFAYLQMLCAMVLMVYCVYQLYVGKSKIFGPVNLALFSAFFIKSLIPVMKFLKCPQKYAKPIIVKSYAPFMIVLFSYMISAFFNRKDLQNKKVIIKPNIQL